MISKEIKVSAGFRAQATKAVVTIGLFVLTYLLMLVFAIGLTVLCVYGGIALIAVRPMLVTIALGIGLASLGVLVLFFLLKFIFKSHKVDRSHLIEIKEEDEPELFSLINDIVNKLGTNFPKKVYLSSDVNAAVFYDSSFWSMFFPIRKNLQIGLGLVNTVSKSELTAILSHEFGHFSQRTMKVGSYVYNVNQVIFNLLFDNETYDERVQGWASVSGYFSIFVLIGVKIIEGIKWVLKQMYGLVNKSYMGLSREMEFHADEVAANITGYEPLKSSLLRLSIADHAFSSVLSFYERKIPDNQRTDNVFRDHLYVTNFIAQENNIEIRNNLPHVSEGELNRFNKSKLVVKDQWASHPSTEDRIAMLERTGLSAHSIDNESANFLFTDIERIQKELTSKIFQEVVYSGECSIIPFELFQMDFKKEYVQTTFPKLYNAYYDSKNPSVFDIQSVEMHPDIQLEELFSEDKVEIVYTALSLRNDIESIKQIADKSVNVRTFDYDGVKYNRSNCKNLLQELEFELNELNEQVKLNDIRIFQFFRQCENEVRDGSTLESLYVQFFQFDNDFNSKYSVYEKLFNGLQFVSVVTPFDEIRTNFLDIEPLEKELKKGILELLESPIYQSELNNELKENFNLYLGKNWQYFANEAYNDSSLEVLYTAMNNYAFLLSRGYFLVKQELLNYQVEVLAAKRIKVSSQERVG